MSATKIEKRDRERNMEDLLKEPYIRMIVPGESGDGYVAEVLELPGCISQGETPEEAYRNLDGAMEGWIGAALDLGRPIPEPIGDKEYSGHLPLRISSELHRLAAIHALNEGVSLNQWIAKAIATQVAKQDLAKDLADQLVSKLADRVRVTASTTVSLQLSETNPADPYSYIVPANLFSDIAPAHPDHETIGSKVLSAYDVFRRGGTLHFRRGAVASLGASQTRAIERKKEGE